MFRERGHERVAQVIELGCLSTLNLAEVLGRFVRDGHSSAAVLTRLQSTAIELVPLSVSHAMLMAAMVPKTQALGLSPGDPACLALAAAMETAQCGRQRRFRSPFDKLKTNGKSVTA